MANEKEAAALTEESKRLRILNAAMAEFINGYEKASTDAIVKSAGVSKGLLFHYFGSKKELFLYAYEYALQTVAQEVFALIDQTDRDILVRLRRVAILKLELMRKHPVIFEFVNRATAFSDMEITPGIAEHKRRLTQELLPRLYRDVDVSLFRPDIDAAQAVNAILYAAEGYAQQVYNPDLSMEDYHAQYDRYMCEFDALLSLFKKTFYR